jgi:hypothetical protein
MDDPNAMSTLTQNGNATLTLGKQPVNISGVLNVSPAKKYGIINAYTVKLTSSAWTMGNGFGNFICGGIVGNLVLEPGGKGQITSLTGSNCHGSYYFCGKESVIRATAPWSVTNEGTYIKIPAASLAVDQKKGETGCESEFTRIYTGELKMTPFGSTSAITNTSIAGYLQEGTGVGWNNSSSLSWTPSGVYGL